MRHEKVKRAFGSVAAVVLTFLALADAPDQLAKWKRYLDSFNALLGVDWSAFWSGPAGRWILVLLGVGIGLWSWDVPQRLRIKFLHRDIRLHDDKHLTVEHEMPKADTIGVLMETQQQSSRPQRLPPDIVAQTMREFRSLEVESAYRRTIMSVDWQREAEGLHFRITNRSPDVVTTFKLFLTDLKLWSPEQRLFVDVKEFHGSDHFPEIELRLAEAKLFHGDTTTAPFLHIEPDDLWFMGKAHSFEVAEKQYVRREGIWEVTLRHELDGKPVIHNEVRCFRWKKGSSPQPCDCPKEADEESYDES